MILLNFLDDSISYRDNNSVLVSFQSSSFFSLYWTFGWMVNRNSENSHCFCFSLFLPASLFSFFFLSSAFLGFFRSGDIWRNFFLTASEKVEVLVKAQNLWPKAFPHSISATLPGCLHSLEVWSSKPYKGCLLGFMAIPFIEQCSWFVPSGRWFSNLIHYQLRRIIKSKTVLTALSQNLWRRCLGIL